MSKTKAQSAELQATVTRLEKELATTQAALTQEQAQHAVTQARANRLERAVATAEYWQQGLFGRYGAIQQLESVPSHETGLIQLGMYQQQEGCLGGRVLPGNRLQTFWHADVPPVAWVLADVQNALLPDGMRYVYLMPSQAPTLGLWAPVPGTEGENAP